MHVGEATGGDSGGGDGGGGAPDLRNSLLLAIQQGKKLKKVDDDGGDKGKARRATIANPKTSVADVGMDLMSALKQRMSLRRAGISGSRKDEEEGGTGDAKPSGIPALTKSQTAPSVMGPKGGDGLDDGPISMSGMASALRAAASNIKEEDGDEGDWSD